MLCMYCIQYPLYVIYTLFSVYGTSRYKVNDERRSFIRSFQSVHFVCSFVRLFQFIHFVRSFVRLFVTVRPFRSFVRLSLECDTVFFIPSPITYVVRQERDGVFKLRATTDPVSSPPRQILPRYCEDFSR